MQEMRPDLTASKMKALTSASNVACIKNSERDLQRLFRREGLSLPIGPTYVRFGASQVPYISLGTWFQFLLEEHPGFLLGGFGLNASGLLLESFWKNFKSNCPEHKVFDLHETRMGRCLPFYLHMDEGVGYRKSGVMVMAMQSPFGEQTMEKFVASEPKGGSRCQADLLNRMASAQCSNAKGSTYKSRFLLNTMPKKLYTGPRDHVYYDLCQMIADECKFLMEDGLVVHGEKWFPVVMGLKGDQPALIKCGRFTRSFRSLGEDRGCCWECLAGHSGYPFEDVTGAAAWQSTVGLVDPWMANNASAFVQIPGYDNKVDFFKRDPFHCFKQSIGGHLAASCIVLLAIDLQVWKVPGQSTEVGQMFKRAFEDFEFFVRFEWRGHVRNNVKAFTREIMHFADAKKFPYSRFKGSDQMLLCRWLKQLVIYGPVFEGDVVRPGICLAHRSLRGTMDQEWLRKVCQAVVDACQGAVSFFHTLHCEGLWLERSVAQKMADDCGRFCRAYVDLAQLCHDAHLARFHLEPSLHLFRHFEDDLRRALRRTDLTWVYSPSAHTCEMDEDFVGKVCRTSRTVHGSAESTARRTVDRYLLRCHSAFDGTLGE